MDNELIYKEREDLDEFLMENQLIEDIYDGPHMDILEKVLRWDSYDSGAVKRFNAVYRQCLQVLNDPHPEDRFASKFLKVANQHAYTHESVFIVALTYGILSLSEHREMRNVKHFLRKVNNLSSRYDFILGVMRNFVQEKQGTNYLFVLTSQQKNLGDMAQQVKVLREEIASLEHELKCKQESMAQEPVKSGGEDAERIMMQMITVGENYPASQNDKAEVFRQFLIESMLEGAIPQSVITAEIKERILRLGRKDQGVSVNAQSLFEISGNENVTIGGPGNAEA